MDKNQNVRRLFSRPFGYNSNKKLVSGNSENEKSSKEKFKRLSVVEREMGFDAEDELYSTKVNSGKFKLPAKIFSDSTTSVPRKLRSAIRKRSCESPSGPLPDAKRPNNKANDVDLLRKDSLEKSKISIQNGCSEHSLKGAASLTISKDEEEVAQTLFALAGMIRLNRIRDKTENDSLRAKTRNLSKKQNSNPTPSSEGPVIPKEESEATDPTLTTNDSPNNSIIDSAPLVWPKLSEIRQLNLDCKVSVPPMHFQIPPLLRACDDKQLTNSTFGGSSEQNQECWFGDARKEKSQLLMRESNNNIGAADFTVSEDRQHATSTECRNNDLTSRTLHGSGIDELPVQSCATIFPSFSSSKLRFCGDTPSAGKAFGSINGERKSWKSCIAHVYISRLIQALQASEGKDTKPSDTNQLSPSQPSSAGQVADNRDARNGTLAAGHMMNSSVNDVPTRLKYDQVEEERPTLSGCCDSKKQGQGFNFLSLSTGAGSELHTSVNGLGITLEAKGQAPQLHSVAQRNTYVPNSLPQNHIPTVTYRDQIAGVSAPPSMLPQVHLQMPPYFGNACGPGHIDTKRSTQQPAPKEQQQIWRAQLAAQFRPGPLLPSHIANWQNSTRDLRAMNHTQTHLPTPRPSLETVGSKYLHISQQQQQQLLGNHPSLPSSNARLQNNQLSSIREDKSGRFHPDGMLPMQLLCNERFLS